MARISLGDRSGLDDLRRSAALAEASNSPETIHHAYNNLANMHWRLGELEAASASLKKARAANERFGYAGGLKWLVGEGMLDHHLRGEWEEALAIAGKVIAAATNSPHYHEGPARMLRSEILLGRGEVDAALTDSARGLELAREAGDGQVVGPALVDRARALVAAGRAQEGDRLLAEDLTEHDLANPWQHQLPLLLAELGRGHEFLAALGDDAPATPWIEAGRAVASRDFAKAAAVYAAIGARAPEAQARLLHAEALVRDGRRTEADAELDAALTYFRSVRATAFTRRGEALLAATA